MARLRYNGLTATLGADLLTAGTTITFTAALSSAAGAVPTITGTDYIPLAVLDTDGSVLEIIHLTAYTTGATTGTVTRAQESTTAADHATGLTVVNGLTVADVAAIEASGGAFIGCRAKRTTNYSVASGVATAIPLDAEDFDTNAMHDNATNNTRITIPTGMGGVWSVQAGVRFAASATGYRTVGINKNGAELDNGAAAYFKGAPPPAGVGFVACGAHVLLAAGDYLEVLFNQGSGGALNVEGATLSAIYVGTP